MDPLATLEEFAARIPGGVNDDEEARATANLEDASALIRAEAGDDFTESVPDVIKTIALAAAKRAFVNPDGISAESLDNFSTSFSTDSPDIYLTKAELRLVRRAGGKGGLWTQPTTRSEDGKRDVPSVYPDGTDDYTGLPEDW